MGSAATLNAESSRFFDCALRFSRPPTFTQATNSHWSSRNSVGMASTSTTTCPFLQRPVRQRGGVDSAAVGDSAVSSTARRWVNSSGCRRPRRGVFAGTNRNATPPQSLSPPVLSV